jgi:hypothetical protein
MLAGYDPFCAGSSRCYIAAAVSGTSGRPQPLVSGEMEAPMVRNGNHAVLAVLALSAIVILLVYVASLPVTEHDGTIDPKESVISPD